MGRGDGGQELMSSGGRLRRDKKRWERKRLRVWATNYFMGMAFTRAKMCSSRKSPFYPLRRDLKFLGEEGVSKAKKN